MNNAETIGTRLRELRKCRAKSCNGVVMDLKRRGLSISRELLDKWERDLRVPNGDAIVKLADYYETTTDYLLGYSDVKLSVDRFQITANTLGLSLAAIENLINISSTRGGRASDILSAILESSQLPALLSVLVDSQNGIDRQFHYLRPRETPGTPPALRPMTLSGTTKAILDVADMYILRASRQTEPLFREVLGYNALAKEASNGEHTED